MGAPSMLMEKSGCPIHDLLLVMGGIDGRTGFEPHSAGVNEVLRLIELTIQKLPALSRRLSPIASSSE
jgi:hypothetical protein